MIPRTIASYLDQHDVSWTSKPHSRAVSAQRLAEALHTPGTRVCKTVLMWLEGRPWMAVLPATELVNPERIAEALAADDVELMSEDALQGFFPDVEVGAEPPFGRLYGMPVVVDETIADAGTIIVRGGTHEDAIELSFDEFERLERPVIADIGLPISRARAEDLREAHV